MAGKKDEVIALFFSAAKEGKVDKLEEILKDKEGITRQKDEDERTALHVAAANNQKECVSFLLNNQADINSQDDEGWSPLHSAVSAGHLEVVKVLLDFSPDLELLTSSGCTPLHYAASKGHIDIMSALLEAGARINAKDKYGRTCLMKAVLGDHEDVFQLLLQKGASVRDLEKITGENALHMAVNNQNVSICTALCLQDASLLTQKNKEGRTPYDECPKELKESLKVFLPEASQK